MSKLAGLQAAHELLSMSRTNSSHQVLLGWKQHPDDPPAERRLLDACLLVVELEDHLHNLVGIADACRHGLASTVPDEHYLTPEEFDPWAVIAEHLGDEQRLPVRQLSPALLAWLDAWPELARRSAARIAEILGPQRHVPWVLGEDGRLRPPTEAEREYEPEREMLATVERTAFALTYAADLTEVATLVAVRGALGRILALVE